MTYSLDLRERVVSYVNDGGSVHKAVSIFDISIRTIHYWMKKKDLSSKPTFLRQRKINKAALSLAHTVIMSGLFWVRKYT